MERGRRSGAAYAARTAAVAAGSGADHRDRSLSRDRDPSASFSGSRSSANVTTSRGKASPPQRVHHVAAAATPRRSKENADAALQNAAQLDPREREIMLQLLVQITDFVARKQQMSKRHRDAAASTTTPDWRKDFRRSRYDEPHSIDRSSSKDLFDVVIQICEERMQQLNDDERGAPQHSSRQQSERDDWMRKPPRVLVAEAMVQELLVSLVEIQMNEKEEMILDEVDTVEIMRQLHAQLEQDEQVVRHRVCAAAGDEQQLQELQLMLRTDFLQEVTHTRATQRLNDATQHSDASLQFAWETIQEQKKEVVRLRAENQELKSRKQASSSSNAVLRDASSASSRLLESSLFNDEPAHAINLLRSQLSSHHDTNLNILHDYILRLEDALRRATISAAAAAGASTPGASSDRNSSQRDVRDASGITFDSSRGEEKENWRPYLSSSIGAGGAVREDFSRTQPVSSGGGRRIAAPSCDQCKRHAGAVVSLQSEVKQLRAQVAADEESLVSGEKEQSQLKRENVALSSALLSAKQQQEELRQMVLDVTHEKHEAQGQSELEQRASERTIRLLRDQLDALDERNKHQARKLERLELELRRKSSGSDATDNQRSHSSSFRSSKRQTASFEEFDKVSEMNTVLRERIGRLQREIEDFDAREGESKQLIETLRRDSRQQQNGSRQAAESALKLQDKDDEIALLNEKVAALDADIDSFQRTLTEKRGLLGERDATIAELKQDKKLLVSLQKVERERSLLHQDELEQAKEECAFLKERLSAAIADCDELRESIQKEKSRAETLRKRLDEADVALKREIDATTRLKQELRDADTRRQTLEDHVSAQLELQQEVDQFKSSHHAEQLQYEELQSVNARLSQEIADAKTTILMWMSKYNALSEQVKRLEDDAQSFSEERYSFQQQVERMEATHKRQAEAVESTIRAKATKEIAVVRQQASAELARVTQRLASEFESKIAELEQQRRDQQEHASSLQTDLAQSKNKSSDELAQLRESNLDLESQVGILKDANRKLQYELLAEERQRKTLGFLVQTLQERPVLQRRAFQEMLLSSQRQFEFTFMQLSNRVERVGQKLLSAELKCETLKDYLRRKKLDRSLRLPANERSSNSHTNSVLVLRHAVKHDDEMESALAVDRHRGVCRMIEKLAMRSHCEALLQLKQQEQDESVEDFVERAELVIVRALQLLETQQQRTSLASAQPAMAIESAVASDSQVTIATNTSSSTDTTQRTISKRESRSVVHLKWRFLVTVVLFKQQLAQKHAAYMQVLAKCMRETDEKSMLAKQVRRWKWKHLAVAATAKAQQATERNSLSFGLQQSKWQMLRRGLKARELTKAVLLMQVQALGRHKRLERLRKVCCFTSWRYESKIQTLETKASFLKDQLLQTQQQQQQQQQQRSTAFSASGGSVLSPVSAVALGNCVRLLQKFCDGTDTSNVDIGASRETLTRYLIESNSKIASWRRTIDRKIHEFSERTEQLARLQDRCNEMHELVALHQKLVEEVERKAASHQSIVDAASAFSRAYKTLRASVSSQTFTTNEFYAACKRVVEAVHASSSLKSVRSVGRAVAADTNSSSSSSSSGATTAARTSSSTVGTSHVTRLRVVDERSEFSSSRVAIAQAVAALSSASVSASPASDALNTGAEHDAASTTSEPHHHPGASDQRRRRKVNDSSIAILETAVGSLKSANEIRALLESALAEKTRLLERAQRQLEAKSVQFVVLRAFLRWKCAAYALRLQEESAQQCACEKQ